MANENLHKARSEKNDEFYTQFNDIQNEVNAYIDRDKNVFRDKVVLLPCDDPEWSAFTKFFALNFKRYGIKRLISTCYAPAAKDGVPLRGITEKERAHPDFDTDKALTHGRILTLDGDENGDGVINVDDLRWTYMEGDGDFRSAEVTALRDEADFVITNPPFSLFREFMAWLIEGKVKLAVLANKNAITYKEIFPLIKNNELWVGKTPMSQDILFGAPAKIDPKKYPPSAIKKIGEKLYLRSPSIWLTNIDHGRRHEPLTLMTMDENLRHNKKMKDKSSYDRYDNYDAIEVPATSVIPSDYDGVMGVPISFLDKYCPEQFKIIGATESEGKGFSDNLWHSESKIAQATINERKVYKRIFIEKRRNKNE